MPVVIHDKTTLEMIYFGSPGTKRGFRIGIVVRK
jgi:hypothetical protein